MPRKQKKLPQITGNFSLIDTHCHLDMAAYTSDIGEVLKNASGNGISSIITIGIDIASSKEAIQLASRHSMVWASVGIHPHDAGDVSRHDYEEIEALLTTGKDRIVGYGEIGLDYVKRYSEPDIQRRAFDDQLSIAKNHKLPVIIHDREAHEDILSILKRHAPFDHGGVMHCFSGDTELASHAADLGLHISIPGIVTFKNAVEMQEVARQIPLDMLLLETDGPFLAPDPYRGKRNEPMYLLYTAEKVASLRGMTIDELADATTANACRLFGIPRQEEHTP